MTSHQKA